MTRSSETLHLVLSTDVTGVFLFCVLVGLVSLHRVSRDVGVALVSLTVAPPELL